MVDFQSNTFLIMYLSLENPTTGIAIDVTKIK